MERQQIKEIAVRMAETEGLINLSRLALCERAGIPDGSFPHVMGCNFSEFIEEVRATGIKFPLMKVKKSRTSPALREEHLLECAVALATVQGYHNVTRDQLAEAAGVSMGLISRYFGTMVQLRKAVVRQAVLKEIPEIIAQGLANGDKQAQKAPDALKTRAAMLLVNL